MESTDNFAFLLPVMMVTFGLCFLALSWLRLRSAFSWGMSFLCGGLAFVAPVLPIAVEAQALVGDLLFFISFYFYGDALLVHFGAPRLALARVGFSALCLGLSAYFVLGLRSLHAELLLVDTALSVLLAVPVAMVAGRARLAVDRILVVFSGLVVLNTFVRVMTFSFLVRSSNQLEDFANSNYAFFMQLSAGTMSLVFALAALASVLSELVLRYRDAAERDPLTGLLNRRGLDRTMTARREPGAVLICDIDHFKLVNDGFGHAVGDRVIVGAAELLKRRLPAGSIVARFGGEEFLAFLPGKSAGEGAEIAHALRMGIAARDWRSVGVTA